MNQTLVFSASSFQYCKECRKKSQPENDVAKFVNSLSRYKMRRNVWDIISQPDSRRELDIYFPTLKRAIEFNGNWYHSDKKRGAGWSLAYHTDKKERTTN